MAAAGGQPPRAALLEGWQFSRAEFGVAETAYQAADPAAWLALETAGRALADAGFPGGQGLAGDRAGVLLGNTLTGEVSRAAALRTQWPFVATVLDAARDADWARVRAGKITVACTVAALDGVPGQVAIALATWPAGDEREAGGPAESGHGASKDTGPTNDEPSSRPVGTGGRLGRPGDSFGRPGDTPGRHSVVS